MAVGRVQGKVCLVTGGTDIRPKEGEAAAQTLRD